MSRYVFDVHVDGAVQWDDEGRECSDKPEIETRVREVMTQAAVDPDNAGKPITSYVAQDGGGIVVTAMMDAGGAFRLVWNET